MGCVVSRLVLPDKRRPSDSLLRPQLFQLNPVFFALMASLLFMFLVLSLSFRVVQKENLRKDAEILRDPGKGLNWQNN